MTPDEMLFRRAPPLGGFAASAFRRPCYFFARLSLLIRSGM